MLQPTDPEMLGNKEDSWRDAWVSLGRENRRDLLSGIVVNGDGNLMDQVGQVWGARLLREMT